MKNAWKSKHSRHIFYYYYYFKSQETTFIFPNGMLHVILFMKATHRLFSGWVVNTSPSSTPTLRANEFNHSNLSHLSSTPFTSCRFYFAPRILPRPQELTRLGVTKQMSSIYKIKQRVLKNEISYVYILR